MKVGMKKIGLILIFGGGLFFSQLCYAREPAVEPVGKYGTIDWVGQKIIATGEGVPSETTQNPAQARAMAKRAAVVVARRNLLEAVKGIRIDSTTRVVDYAVQDDTIISRVKGVLNNSRIEGYKYGASGVTATVSIPFSGQLGQILIRAVQPAGTPVKALNMQKVAKRILELENRVSVLENKLSGIKRLNFEQEQKIQLFQQFIEAWANYMASGPHLRPVDYESDKNLAALKNELSEQASTVAELTRRLEDMAGRLTLLETSGSRPAPKEEIKKSSVTVAYTGLVIDARHTDFRPCLKPAIFSQGQRIYPGDYVNLSKAIRRGYVRYYRKIERAQQSTRTGSLPFTITAKGTYQGTGALEIDNKEFNILKKLIEKADNFMANGDVVIVF